MGGGGIGLGISDVPSFNPPYISTYRTIKMRIVSSRHPMPYTVQTGDTLRNIVVRHYNLNPNNDSQVLNYMRSVAEDNHIVNPNNIRSGQELFLYYYGNH